MLQYLIMCRSLTYAQRASRLLERSGITAVVTKAPKTAIETGCAYGIKVNEKRITDVLRIFKENDLQPVRVLIETKDRTYREVPDFE